MGIPEQVLERLLPVFRKESTIQRVFLFGSRARGDFRSTSDIDLALEGSNIPETVWFDIQDAAGLYKVDVVFLSKQLEPDFMEEFNEDAVLLYQRDIGAAITF